MSDQPSNNEMAEGPQAEAPKPAAQRDAAPAEKEREEQIYLVPFPKLIFFYPTLIAAIVAAVWMSVTGRHAVDPDDRTAVILTCVFLGVLAVNLAIITFDFPRGTSLTLFFFLVALVLGAILLFTFYPALLPDVTKVLRGIRPVANATFFIVFSAVLAVIYGIMFITVRFNYWEVRPNELLHHHGILSDLKRYSAPQLRVDKEINDIFEFFLLRSGRLILHPSDERRAVILDNVLFIDRKEKAITKMLGALQVEVRRD